LRPTTEKQLDEVEQIVDGGVQPACSVEIVLRNGRRVRVRATIDTAALKRIIDVLEDR